MFFAVAETSGSLFPSLLLNYRHRGQSRCSPERSKPFFKTATVVRVYFVHLFPNLKCIALGLQALSGRLIKESFAIPLPTTVENCGLVLN